MPKGKTKNSSPKHTHFREGTKVVVTLKDGSMFIDSFGKLGRKKIEFRKRGRVGLEDILSIKLPVRS